MKIPLVTLLILFLTFRFCYSAERMSIQELEEKVADYKKRIAQTEEEVTEVNKEKNEEEENFSAYSTSYKKRRTALKGEIDSLEKDISIQEETLDSLEEEQEASRNKEQRYEYHEDNLRKVLVDVCDSIYGVVSNLPVSWDTRHKNTIDLLRSEIKSQDAGLIEGIDRLTGFYASLLKESKKVDTWKAREGIKGLQGKPAVLRIGNVYLAASEPDNDRAFIRVDSTWIPVESEEGRKKLKKAFSIREGNAVPEITELPFNHGVVRERGGSDEH